MCVCRNVYSFWLLVVKIATLESDVKDWTRKLQVSNGVPKYSVANPLSFLKPNSMVILIQEKSSELETTRSSLVETDSAKKQLQEEVDSLHLVLLYCLVITVTFMLFCRCLHLGRL